ncbi:hypothetical protein AYI70_g11191 [Smittium culicis]|uniref:Reverse transcriptase domain-containing protein n=1 Tax=Smittium culicis TaxID=133412 RepID=A0A1R1X2Y8_9FUNG|nr:hypothetical protein AYI70_g11191 [Smittium culicis]
MSRPGFGNLKTIKNLQNWIFFVEYSKAYDRVPHIALIHKLRVYYDAKIAARIGNDISESSEYHCGVRQGCTASPILFDLYINYIFSGIFSVDVPGLPNRIPGMLLADDAVVLAD